MALLLSLSILLVSEQHFNGTTSWLLLKVVTKPFSHLGLSSVFISRLHYSASKAVKFDLLYVLLAQC